MEGGPVDESTKRGSGRLESNFFEGGVGKHYYGYNFFSELIFHGR